MKIGHFFWLAKMASAIKISQTKKPLDPAVRRLASSAEKKKTNFIFRLAVVKKNNWKTAWYSSKRKIQAHRRCPHRGRCHSSTNRRPSEAQASRRANNSPFPDQRRCALHASAVLLSVGTGGGEAAVTAVPTLGSTGRKRGLVSSLSRRESLEHYAHARNSDGKL